MSLLIALAAATVTATCVPSANPAETREEVVDSFFAAMAKHDAAAMGRYVKPGARMMMGSDSMDLAEMLGAINPSTTLTVLDKTFNPDKTITVHFSTVTGDDKDEAAASIAQEGGCITSVTHV
jgi:hypothetical protein